MELRNEEKPAERNLVGDFFTLLERQPENKLPANTLVALLGLFNLLHIFNYAGGGSQEARQQGSQPLREALFGLLTGQKPDLSLGDMASMLNTKNPSALMNLFSMLAGSTGVLAAAPPGKGALESSMSKSDPSHEASHRAEEGRKPALGSR